MLINFFSGLREKLIDIAGDPAQNPIDVLQQSLDRFDNLKGKFGALESAVNKFNDCGVLDFSCSKTVIFATDVVPAAADLGLTAVFDAVDVLLDQAKNAIKGAKDLLYGAYLRAWAADIDEGLRHWGDLGLSVTKGLFDPQARRDLQNKIAQQDGLGPDSGNPDTIRSRAEDKVGLVDTVLEEVDPFINDHLLPMLGGPLGTLAGKVREALSDFGDFLNSEILGPLKAVFNPLRQAFSDLKEFAKNIVKDQISQRLGVDIDQIQDFLDSPSSKMDVTTVSFSGYDLSIPGLGTTTVGAVSFTLFQPGDHAKLDAYLGLTNPDHHGGSGGGLGDDAEFDPDPDTTAFASYRDAVTMGKLLLLDGHGMDDVVHNLLGWPAGLSYQLYDNPFQLNHIDTVNGNVLTTVLPDVAQLNLAKLDGENSPPLASEGWLRLIDGDHAWRIDGLPVFTREFSQSNGFPLAGTGNFPLWESCLLRDKVFRVLFRDWESQYRDPNAQNFPDYGDDASHDPNEKSPKQVFDVATGTWTITGSGFDDTFTISTQLDPMGREVIQIAFPRTDFYCEDVFQQKLADVHKIVIDAGAGADSITVATNIAIPVDILGGDGDDTLTAGYVGGPSRRITFDGGGQPGDTAILSGTGSMVGVYTPDKNVQGSGKFTITGPDANMLTVDFSTLTNATASDLGQLSLVASNGKNVLGLDRPQDGRNRIKGESGGYGIALKLLDLTFFDVADVTLDTRTNNTDSNFGDAITIDRAGLVATRLKNFTVRTGPGNDVLVVHSPSFALPVPGGKFAFDAGTGGSNLQGLISLDRIEADSDVDYSLTDTDLTSSGGSRIVLSGVEGAVLTGGPGANILDASKFSGPVVLNGGPGNDTLRGGLGNNTLNGGEDADALYAGDDGFHRPGLGSQANVLQGGGGINLLRGGPGDDTLYANLYGTATLMGEGGDDSFIVTSPAGVVTDPAGGLVVVGGGQPGDILRLVGGGGPTYNQVYMVGPDSTGPHLIAEPDSLGFTPGGPDAFLPHAVAPIDHFDGEIITTNYYNRTGPTISQFLRFTGLAAIDDSLTANELTVMGASASAPIAGASGLDLASGRMRLTVGGKSFAAISFANKTKPSVLLAGGQVVTAAVPTLAGPVSAPLAVTVSTPTVAGALTTVSASTAFADTSVASVQAVTAPAATVSLDTASANPAPTVAVGSVALRFNTAKRLAGRPVAHPQKKEKAAPAAQWATNHLPKGPLGHKVASKATARPRPSAGRSNLTFPSTKAGVRSVLEKPSMHWVNRLHSATSTVSGS